MVDSADSPTDLAGVDGPAILTDAEGRVRTANRVALETLGLGLSELRALPRGALSADPDESRALSAEWERAGSDRGMGEATVVRLDGRRLRIAFVVQPRDDGYLINFEPVAHEVNQPVRMYTLGSVLSAWRAAERRLEEIDPDSPDWHTVQEEIETLRAEHRVLFGLRSPPSDS